MYDEKQPRPFLKVIVHDLALSPGLSGLCASFDDEKWRCDELADHLMEWLPEFCLNWSERRQMGSDTAVRLIKEAARRVYTTEKFKNRGEFGELLLHVALRQMFNTLPAISKIYYKDSTNITVKGFDAVHIVATEESLELWLGEVKFYNDIATAIRDVVDELKAHTTRDYLKDEFVAITNKIDNSWPHAERLKKLLDRNTSLDEIFDTACIPVLLTYDSRTTQAHKRHTPSYAQEIEAEFRKHHASFISRNIVDCVKIQLFLVPLATKASLIEALDKKLKAWQNL